MKCDWERIPGTKSEWRCRRCLRTVSMGYEHLSPAQTKISDCPEVPHAERDGLVGRVVRYAAAVSRWAAAGMPRRSEEEIERYYRRCIACEHYDVAGHRCRRCGCRVNTDAAGWRNKIAMATERCPIGRWPDEPSAAPPDAADKAAGVAQEAATADKARQPREAASDGEAASGGPGDADDGPSAPSAGAPSTLGAEALRADLRGGDDGPPPLSSERLRDYFDRVYLINLRSRPDRLEAFWRRLERCDWPFRTPIVYPAIHGDTVGVPEEFASGGGAYGCRMSHLRILQDCLMAGVESVLILEDDADVRAGFAAAAARWLARVPDDWQGLMLGGQHHTVPDPTDDPEVVRVRNAQRTHAYAARPAYMRALQQRWGNCAVHIDWAMKDWQHKQIVYAPARWLVGQAGGRSDIAGRNKPPEWWNRADGALPVVVLRAPRAVFEELIATGRWHGGYRRDARHGWDVGLPACVDPRASADERARRMRQWIECVGGEAEGRAAVCVVWHPEITRDCVAAAWDGPVVELWAESAEEAERCLPAWIAPHDRPIAHAKPLLPHLLLNGVLRYSDIDLPPKKSNQDPICTLYINAYRANEPRQAELSEALRLNLANPRIHRIVCLCENGVNLPADDKLVIIPFNHRATYGDFRTIVNHCTTTPWDINIVANADISFDDSLSLLAGIDFYGYCFALTRHDRAEKINTQGQDAWIFQGPIVLREPADFPLGSPCCDWRFAYVLHRSGYVLVNCLNDIRITHHHASGIRNHGPQIPGPHISRVPESSFAQYRFQAQRHKRGGIIGYSLFGDDQAYTEGAIANARIAPMFYPGWTVRFYVSATIPGDTIKTLLGLGAEVVVVKQQRREEGYFWRFLVADEPGYVRWAVRDCDSLPSLRERAAVDDWIASGYPVHTTRDHPAHKHTVMACCFNGLRGALSIATSMLEWIAARQNLKYGDDEAFLEQVVTSQIGSERLLVHSDAGNGPGKCRPFPRDNDLGGFVGERVGRNPEVSRDDRKAFAIWHSSLSQRDRP